MISVQMATCTAGRQPLPTGAMAVVALSAAATKCASTTPWPPRLLQLLLSGIMKQMMAHLIACWHKAMWLLVGAVMTAAASGVQQFIPELAPTKQTGCPHCSQKRKIGKCIKHPTLAEWQDPHGRALLAEWDHERNAPCGKFPLSTSLKSNKQIFWLCTKCPAGQQHSWSAMLGS